MAAVNARLAQAAARRRQAWPGLIGVDQEGGIVARLGAPLTEWPTPMSYGAAGNVPLTKDAGRALAAELAPLGFTVDFAPDADVTIGPADPTIGARSIPETRTSRAARVAFSQGMQEAGVLPAVKHFPGHGSVTVDSHQDLPVQPAAIAELEARDWKPFRAAIAAGAPMVMTGHIAVPALEPGVPASLSGADLRGPAGHGLQGRGGDRRPEHGCRPEAIPGRLGRPGGARGRGGPAADACRRGAGPRGHCECRGRRNRAGGAPGRGRHAGGHHDDLARPDRSHAGRRRREPPRAAAATPRRGSPPPPSLSCPGTAPGPSHPRASGSPAAPTRTGHGSRRQRPRADSLLGRARWSP